MTTISPYIRNLLALALATTMATPASAQFNANYQIAIPVRLGALTPTFDGILNATEWSGSALYRMEDGAPQPAAYMRAMANGDNIWLGFQAEDNTCDQDTQRGAGCVLTNYPLFGADDIIVVAYNINGTNSGYRRLHIQPCFALNNAGDLNKCPINASANSQVANVRYWEGQYDGIRFTWIEKSVPGVIEARTASAPEILIPGDFPSRGTWSVELKLPRVTVPVQAGGFGLFVDVIPTNSWEDTAVQYAWPSDRQIAGPDGTSIAAQIESTPPPATWGIALLGDLAAGVSIVGFGSNGSDPTKISRTTPNEFNATLANGSAAAASGLVATFRIANWGVSGGSWAQIPSTAWTPGGGGLTRSNPTLPIALNQNEYRTVYSGLWAPTGTTYAPPNNHQCVRVEVVGNNGVNTQRQFNMDFDSVNSPFTGTPKITLPKPSALIDRKAKPKITLREQFINVEPEMRWKTEIGGAKRLDNGTWLVQPKPQGATQLETAVLVDDSLKLPVRDFALTPENAAGLKIEVEPGSTITLLADGAFKSRLGTVTPAGLNERKRITTRPVKLLDTIPSMSGALVSFVNDDRTKFRIRPNKNPIRPWALIGSFDEFRTSFLIGPAATFTVPERSDVLVVRLAPVAGLDLPADGDGYAINVVGQATRQLATIPEVDPGLFGKSGLTLLPLGANLPAWVVRAEIDTGRFVTINGKIYKSRLPFGSFGSFITRVRQ
jgi:hypothetical protein